MIEHATNKPYATYMENADEFSQSRIISELEVVKHINKPKTAWWGSPLNASFGWKDWCINEEFGKYDFNNPIIWHLDLQAKIFKIDWEDVQSPYSLLLDYVVDSTYNTYIDFIKMKKNGIHAVELMDACIGHMFINPIEVMFNSWDCESICVLDSSMIIFDNK